MNENKVLLIHPHKIGKKRIQDYLRYPPLGITTLAAVLRNKGFIPYIYDANVEAGDPFKKISELIYREKIGVIGFSFTTILAPEAFYCATKLKQEFPHIPIIAGGYHPTVVSEEVAQHPAIDYVVVGEGEITLPSLLKVLLKRGDPESVEGLCFKRHNEIIRTPPRSLISNIDDIPIPAYDLLNLNHYNSLLSTRKTFITVVRSRGCPFNCSFCGVDAIFSRRYRCQSPTRTLEEVLYLIKQYRIREILFKDSDFLINRKNSEEFCNLLMKKRLDLIWRCNARVDMVDKDILGLMKRAGCAQITFGIESGSQKMLDTLKKGFTIEHIVKAIRLTKDQGIACIGGFIIGAPGENKETIAETIRLIKKLDLDYASFHFLTAFPGSALYNDALENKWFIENQQAEYEGLNMNASNLTNTELKKAMQQMIRSFYFRPSYFRKHLVRTTPKKICNNFVECFGLVRKILRIGM